MSDARDDGDIVDVAVGVLIGERGRFLLTSRPAGKVYAGWWEFPGGKLERGEAVEAALARADAPIKYATEDRYLGDDRLFGYCSQLAMGLALLRARHLCAPAEQLTVWDGGARAG
ncbi:MAG TPA: NUDIX domain-containing protein, partial [Caldimonas sp.]|nr:NUDIX domain-containing protein [Caldimonas sp.]